MKKTLFSVLFATIVACTMAACGTKSAPADETCEACDSVEVCEAVADSVVADSVVADVDTVVVAE